MNKPRISRHPRMTQDIVQSGLISEDPFFLLDIGASGGIDAHWRGFGNALRAIGFDPLIRECERLNRKETLPGVRYRDGFVGVDRIEDSYAKPDQVRRAAPWDPNVYPRSSAIAAMELMRASSNVRYNNNDPDLRMSAQHFSLDTFLAGEKIPSVDFLKIDTDGYDFEVLTGARDTLATRQLLGLFVECQFHGAVHRHANIFANIDTLLRNAGFALYNLDLYRYTRRALPGRFRDNLPGATRTGQLLWADALYLRDYVAEDHASRGVLSATKILKLACLYEKFGLFDCAVELLLTERDAALAGLPIDRWLDLLAGQISPGSHSYAALIKRFESDPRSFFPPPRRTRSALSAGRARLARMLSRVVPRPSRR
jgi:FkbM family methyltransferase